jgi:hypothetical protein
MAMPMRRAANFILLSIAGIVVLAAMLIVAGMLGRFLLGITLVLIFAVVVYAGQGLGISGPWVLLTMVVLFLMGYGAQNYMMSTIMGFDPISAGYTTGMTAIKLDTVGFGWSDSTFSMVLGFIVIVVIVILAMAGMLAQARRKR